MGNMSKRQQPDHRTENSRRSPIGLQYSDKFPHPEAFFSCPLNKYTSSVIVYAMMYLPPNYSQETKIKNNTRLTKCQRLLTRDRRKNAAGLNMFMRSQPSPYTSSQCRKVM